MARLVESTSGSRKERSSPIWEAQLGPLTVSRISSSISASTSVADLSSCCPVIEAVGEDELTRIGFTVWLFESVEPLPVVFWSSSWSVWQSSTLIVSVDELVEIGESSSLIGLFSTSTTDKGVVIESRLSQICSLVGLSQGCDTDLDMIGDASFVLLLRRR